MALHYRSVAFVLLALGLAAAVRAQHVEAPNVVVIGQSLVTSGQPSATALAGIAQQGFKVVVYLVPSSVPDAVKNEPELLAKQGVEFIHIPIPFGSPTEAHFEAVSQVLQRLRNQKVLVHCQVNMRASTMVFLHRVIKENVNPAVAWEAVTRVWSPEGPWKHLVIAQLAKHGVKFDPF
jgi:protein tyrosine phosphatase (PTP) superfamily phosphohydrolase (DUF442 family)